MVLRVEVLFGGRVFSLYLLWLL